jgi:hypothetical protein
MRQIMLLVLPAACQTPHSDTALEADTALPASGWFDEAVLDPPFHHANAVWAGAALLDFDGDGWLDIFFTNGASHPDALYRNNGDGTFTDVAAQAGVDSLEESGSVVAGDIDNDGDTDLIVQTECSTGSWSPTGLGLADGARRILRNSGDGTFTATAIEGDAVELRHCGVSMTLGDLNSDGWLDLVMLNGSDPDVTPPWIFDKHAEEAVNAVMLGDGRGSFLEPVALDGTETSFAAVLLDRNADGRLDLVIGEGGGHVETHLQDDDGTLSVSQHLSRETGQGLWMGLAVADFDNDADLDLYGTNMGLSPFILGYTSVVETFPGSVFFESDLSAPQGNSEILVDGIYPFHGLFLADGESLVRTVWPLSAPQLLAGDLLTADNAGSYTAWTNARNLERYAWSWGVVPVDVDADGWVDVAFTSNNCSAPMDIIWTEEQGAGPGGLLLNDHGAGFVDVTWEAGVANLDEEGRYQDGRGLVTGDLNNDGYPDLVYVNRTYNTSENSAGGQHLGQPRIWLSQPRSGGWLQIKLIGSTSSRDPMGAVVLLDDGEHTRALPYGVGGGTSSSSELLLTVGLGEVQSVDLEVRFPSGATASLTDVAANQRISIEEPQ